MAKRQREYTVAGFLTISVVKVIKASSEEEAIEKASNLVAPGLCHQCAEAGEDTDDTWTLNGWDDPDSDNIQYIDDIEVKKGQVMR